MRRLELARAVRAGRRARRASSCSSTTASSGATSRSWSTPACAAASRPSSVATRRSPPTTSRSMRIRRSATTRSSPHGSERLPVGPFGAVGRGCTIDARLGRRPRRPRRPCRRTRSARPRAAARARSGRLAVSTGAAGHDLVARRARGLRRAPHRRAGGAERRDRSRARAPPDRRGPPCDRAVRGAGARRAPRRALPARLALRRHRKPASDPVAVEPAPVSILGAHGRFREAGPLTPAANGRARIQPARTQSRRRAFSSLEGGNARWRIT